MGRYDLAINKKKKEKFVSAPDTIADDIQNQTFGNPNEATGAQTVIRGKNLIIRGPNGFQVSIPLRFVVISSPPSAHGNYCELRLMLTPSTARLLSQDIQSAQEDPNERFRTRDVESYYRDRVEHVTFRRPRTPL
jgi:hypothetical protein